MAIPDTRDWRTEEPANRVEGSLNRTDPLAPAPPPVTTPARAEETSMEVVTGGSAAEAIGGLAAAVLAVVGLAMTGVIPFYLTAIAAIVVGASLLIEGGAIMARYSRLLDEATHARLGRVGLGGGMTAEFGGGAAGIVLGILALLHIAPLVLLPVSAIVFGASLLLSGGTMSRLNTLSTWGCGVNDTTRRVMGEAVTAAGGAQVLVGVAAIILGIIALVGVEPLTLSLVALLCLGCSILLSGAAVSGKMMSMLNR